MISPATRNPTVMPPPSPWKIAVRLVGGIALLWVILTGALYAAMIQPQETFGAVMKHVPPVAMAILPFKPLWMSARGGHLQVREPIGLEPLRVQPLEIGARRGERPAAVERNARDQLDERHVEPDRVAIHENQAARVGVGERAAACGNHGVPDRLEHAKQIALGLAKERFALPREDLGDRPPLLVGDPGGRVRRVQHDRGVGLTGRADRDPVEPLVLDVEADLEAEPVPVERQGGLVVVLREHAGVDRDVHGGHASDGSLADASRFLTGLVTCLAMHAGMPIVAPASRSR